MTVSCESFLDYSYDGDIVLEMFNPIKEFLNTIEKLASAIQRIINNFRKLKKITIPTKYLDLFEHILEYVDYEKGFSIIYKYLNGRSALDISEEEAERGAEELNNLVDSIENSGLYQVFVNLVTVEPDLPESEYSIMDSRDFIKFMNKDIRIMAKTRSIAKTTIKSIPASNRKFLNAYVRFLQSRIKLYSKVLSFKKVSNESFIGYTMDEYDDIAEEGIFSKFKENREAKKWAGRVLIVPEDKYQAYKSLTNTLIQFENQLIQGLSQGIGYDIDGGREGFLRSEEISILGGPDRGKQYKSLLLE